MKLNLNCILCNVKQVLTVTNLLKVGSAQQELIMREVLGYLQTTNYHRSNPEVIKGTWDIITQYIQNENPYKEIKNYYNVAVMKMADQIQELIKQGDDGFQVALKIAITGNLIDFAGNHDFDAPMLLEKINNIHKQPLAIDDSKKMYEKLTTANTLLYLGDNCGEIVIDKIFIAYIKQLFPKLKVYFGVRGKPIVNDVTVEDAVTVQMQEVAEVISNGDGSLGTVIEKTSTAFKEVFYTADVVIAKGQGNYESLSEIDRSDLFFLFMAKCDAVAQSLQVANLSSVCAEYQWKKNEGKL